MNARDVALGAMLLAQIGGGVAISAQVSALQGVVASRFDVHYEPLVTRVLGKEMWTEVTTPRLPGETPESTASRHMAAVEAVRHEYRRLEQRR